MNNQLIDQCGRHINYLRLSVTDRCDLRCKYCMPKGFRDFSAPQEWLNFDEIEKTVSLFAQAGIEHLRITGENHWYVKASINSFNASPLFQG